MEENIQLNIWDYIEAFCRRRWFFFLPFILIFSVATIGSFFLPKVYRTTAILFKEESESLNPLAKSLPRASGEYKEELEGLRRQVLTWVHLQEVVETLNLDRGIKNEEGLERLILSIEKSISFGMSSSQVIHVSCEDKDAKRAQLIANTVARLFVQQDISLKESEADEAIEFIEGQVEIYQKKLEDSEEALRRFKEIHLVELPGETNVNVSRLVGFQTALLEIELELKEARKKAELLKNQFAKQKEFIISAIKEADPVVKLLNSKLVELQVKLTELKARKCTEEHPLVVAIKNEMEEVEKRLLSEKEKTTASEKVEATQSYQNINEKLNEIEIKIDGLEARKKELLRLINEYQQKAGNVPKEEKELVQLTRDSDVNKKIHSMLLEKLESTNISKRLDASEKGRRFRVIDPARLPLSPIKPKKIQIIFLGFVMGIGLGIASVFLSEYSDHSFRKVEEAKAYLGIPALGSISRIITQQEMAKARRNRRKVFILSTFLFILVMAMVVFITRLI
ncbi:MAG: XrtA system polysaccharide chain length determinant [Candidatus Desantisbacteria bacterium]